MKRTIYLVVALAVLCIAPVYAQGAFTDVPSEHWAYDAIDTLQARGILIGYPDGTFQGKRAMSRYELAVVIARLLEQMPVEANLSNLATKAELEAVKNSIPGAPGAPGTVDLSGLATKDDLATVRKLVDGFKDELQALGVDVDQVKRDLAALSARVDAIEAELRRVRFTGSFNVIAKVYSDNTPNENYASTGAILIDQDGRSGNPINNAAGHVGSSALRDINVYRDFDLNLVGRVNENTTATAVINFGNYINYLNSGSSAGASDAFIPYYMNIATDLGFGNLTVGRFPLQLGNYTFRMPDVDSYVEMAKTDSGNRPVDGAMLKTGLLGLDWTWFAAQHEKVPMYTGFAPFTPAGWSNVYGVPFTQSAGVQLGANLPANIRLGATYYQGWDKNNYLTTAPDLMEVLGADFSLPVPFVGGAAISGMWAQAKQTIDDVEVLDSVGTEVDDVAWEGRLDVPIGGLALGVGYRSIGKEFAAPGAWDKIGYINNPVNVIGWNADLGYNFSDRLAVKVGGELLKIRNPGGITLGGTGFAKDDEITKIVGGIDWAYSGSDSLGLDVEFIESEMSSMPAGADEPQLSYVTLNWVRQMGENARLKVGYQYGDFGSGFPCGTGDPAWKGSIGVVQLGVAF